MHAKETCLIWVKHLSEPEQNNEFFYSPEVLMDKLKKNSEPRIFLKPRGIQSEKPKVFSHYLTILEYIRIHWEDVRSW